MPEVRGIAQHEISFMEVLNQTLGLNKPFPHLVTHLVQVSC